MTRYEPYIAPGPTSVGPGGGDLEVATVNDGKPVILAQAEAVVAELVANLGNRDLADTVCRVGMRAEDTTQESYDFLQQRVRTSLHDMQTGKGVAGDLIRDMAALSAAIAPMNELAQPSRLIDKIFAWFPGASLYTDKLRKTGAYYTTHNDQIQVIIGRAQVNKQRLIELNEQNKQFRDTLAENLERLDDAHALAEAVASALDNAIQVCLDDAKKRQLKLIHAIVITRVESTAQTRATINMDLSALETRIVDNEIWVRKVANQLLAAPRLLNAAMFISQNFVESQRIADSLNARKQGVISMETLADAKRNFTEMFVEEASAREVLLTEAQAAIAETHQLADDRHNAPTWSQPRRSSEPEPPHSLEVG